MKRRQSSICSKSNVVSCFETKVKFGEHAIQVVSLQHIFCEIIPRLLLLTHVLLQNGAFPEENTLEQFL